MRTTDLSKGKPSKVLILFALPMILSVTLQQIYNIADSVIAGRLINPDALASVSASYPITMIYLSIATGLGVGAGVITSRHFGEKNYVKTRTTIYTAFIFTLLVSIVMIILCSLIVGPSLKLIDTPSNIMEDSKTYLSFYCFGLGFMYLYNVTTSIFQSLGNSKTPLFFLLFSTILNVILDLIFVGLCDLKVLGLALGTFIAQGVAMLASLSFLLLSLNKSLGRDSKGELFDKKILRSILNIAIPSIIQGATIAVGNFFIQKNVNQKGSDFIAGYGAAYKLCYVVVNIFGAYNNALSNYTSQNIGAGRHKRILAGFICSVVIEVSFAIVMAVILVSIPEPLLNIFMNKNKKSAAAIDYGKWFIYIVAPFFIFMGLKSPSDGILKGSKDMLSFMMGTFTDLIARIALSYILDYYLGFKGLFIAWPIGWFLGALVSNAMRISGRWKKKAGFPSDEEVLSESID